MISPTGNESYEEFLNAFRFSFSSVNSYNNCPRCFWLSYLQDPKLEQSENAFAQWGSFMHSIYERFYGGKLDFFDICAEYEDQYHQKVTIQFPPNAWVDLNKKYYEAGLDAIELIDDLPSHISVLDIECKIRLKICDISFVGYADLILQNTETEDIIIVDHKSKSKFKSKAEQKEYARQLYLYSLYVKDKYGKYPSKLVFNMFRVGQMVEIDFKESDLQEAVDWFANTVSQIYMDSEWKDKILSEYENKQTDIAKFDRKDFFCNQLCGVRQYCPRSQDFKAKKK